MYADVGSWKESSLVLRPFPSFSVFQHELFKLGKCLQEDEVAKEDVPSF